MPNFLKKNMFCFHSNTRFSDFKMFYWMFDYVLYVCFFWLLVSMNIFVSLLCRCIFEILKTELSSLLIQPSEFAKETAKKCRPSCLKLMAANHKLRQQNEVSYLMFFIVWTCLWQMGRMRKEGKKKIIVRWKFEIAGLHCR